MREHLETPPVRKNKRTRNGYEKEREGYTGKKAKDAAWKKLRRIQRKNTHRDINED